MAGRLRVAQASTKSEIQVYLCLSTRKRSVFAVDKGRNCHCGSVCTKVLCQNSHFKSSRFFFHRGRGQGRDVGCCMRSGVVPALLYTLVAARASSAASRPLLASGLMWGQRERDCVCVRASVYVWACTTHTVMHMTHVTCHM
jgi:hypothetical protein